MRRSGVHTYDRRTRILVLITMGIAAIGRGVAYLTPDYNGTAHLHIVEILVPIQVWSAVWIAAGAALLAGIWRPQIARWAMATSSSMWAVWALSYASAQVFTDAERAWVTSISLAALAVCNAALLYLMQPAQDMRRARSG